LKVRFRYVYTLFLTTIYINPEHAEEIENLKHFCVQGYSDKQKVLLTKIMDKLTNFQVKAMFVFNFTGRSFRCFYFMLSKFLLSVRSFEFYCKYNTAFADNMYFFCLDIFQNLKQLLLT